MNSNGRNTARSTSRRGPEGGPDLSRDSRPFRSVQARGGRRLLAPLAGASLALALLAGCGGNAESDPAEDPVVDAPAEENTGAAEEAPEEDTSDDEQEDGTEQDDGAGQDDGTDSGSNGSNNGDQDGDAGSGSDTDEPADGDKDDAGEGGTEGGEGGTEAGGAGTNLFEGTWGFGHDSKKLTPEEVGTVVEEEAKKQGPSEMSLTVTCEDGIDTAAQDYTAACTAIADEGVEHAWLVEGLPADAGLEVSVENTD